MDELLHLQNLQILEHVNIYKKTMSKVLNIHNLRKSEDRLHHKHLLRPWMTLGSL